VGKTTLINNFLKKSKYKLDLTRVTDIYNTGSVIESRLVGWLKSAFVAYGEDLKKVSGSVGHTGEGQWTAKTARELGVEISIVLDVIHVLEYLWEAAHCFHPPGSQDAEQWVTKRLIMLLEGADASTVAAGMTRSATRQGLAVRKAVDKCARYLRNNRAYLDYAGALRDGLPIATGVVEGACRFLVRQRLDIAGARWGVAGAEAVLRLRALKASGDFDAYWQYHTATEHRANHASRYIDAMAPDPIPRRPLRAVK